MKTLVKIIIFISIISCKENPSYNPFDNQFNVSVNRLIKDNCDTISAGCGYYNLVKKAKRLRPYYQISSEDFYQVVGKGFIFELDTHIIKNFKEIYSDKVRLDSIVNLPIDEYRINLEFDKFNYKILDRDSSIIRIINKEEEDTINLEISTFSINRNHSIVRGISYFKVSYNN